MSAGSCSRLCSCSSDWWPDWTSREGSPRKEMPSQHSVVSSHHGAGMMALIHGVAEQCLFIRCSSISDNVQLSLHVDCILLSGLRLTWIWMLDYTLWCTHGKQRMKIIEPKWLLTLALNPIYLLLLSEQKLETEKLNTMGQITLLCVCKSEWIPVNSAIGKSSVCKSKISLQKHCKDRF